MGVSAHESADLTDAMSAAERRLRAVLKAYDVRGVVPDQWGLPEARALGAAASQVLAIADGHSRMVIGYDMRPSSPELAQAFAQAALDSGVDVTMIGLCSTDALYCASGLLDSPGAMFTASHNPAQYNGIKFCRAGALGVGTDTGLDDIRQLAQEFLVSGTPVVEQAGVLEQREFLAEYGNHLRSLVDLSEIRPLRVVIDAGNGMAGLTVPAVLQDGAGLPPLPLSIVPMYFDLDGTFPNHEANPLDPTNLVDLQKAVVEHGADLGIAFDGDADRCFFIDEKGDPVSPSAITAMVALRAIAAAEPGSKPVILHNLIVSKTVPELVTEAGGVPVRTRVGHSYIKTEMARTGAVFGGEHSAHYYFAEFWGADTGMLAAMHVLATMGAAGEPLSQLAGDYERYVASGEINSTVADAAEATDRVRAALAERVGDSDTMDGLTMHAKDHAWWINVRASNTEPLLRLNVEAKDQATMVAIRDEVLALIRG